MRAKNFGPWALLGLMAMAMAVVAPSAAAAPLDRLTLAPAVHLEAGLVRHSLLQHTGPTGLLKPTLGPSAALGLATELGWGEWTLVASGGVHRWKVASGLLSLDPGASASGFDPYLRLRVHRPLADRWTAELMISRFQISGPQGSTHLDTLGIAFNRRF